MDNRKFQSASSASPPAVEAAPSTGYPTDGNPSTATPATIPGARWFHQIGEELRNVIASAGLTPSDSDLTQLQQAIAALFAPIANPTFTGDPKAPTAPQFDNDTSLATTQFVQKALGNMSAYSAYSTSQEIAPSEVGRLITFNTAGLTLTIPSTSNVPAGAVLIIYGNSFGGVVQKAGGDNLFNGTSGSITNFTVGKYDRVHLVSIGYAGWYVIGGEVALKTSSAMAASIAASGYQKLPSGLIIQWGTVTCSTGGAVTWTYPIAFSSVVRVGPIGVLASVAQFSNIGTPTLTSVPVSAFDIAGARTSNTVNMFAIGY